MIAVIDGPHIRIQAPELRYERDYVNRKGFHSINVQTVVDNKGRFLNVVAKWPGCTHDSFILKHSNVWDAFEQRQLEGIILGDTGYPNKRWLMTPFANPRLENQRRLIF